MIEQQSVGPGRYFGQGAPTKTTADGQVMDRHILLGEILNFDPVRQCGYICALPPIVHQGQEVRFYFPLSHYLGPGKPEIGSLVEFELAAPFRWGQPSEAAINVQKFKDPPTPPLPLTWLEKLLRKLHLIPVR